MIYTIDGAKGTGKTKKIIDQANDCLEKVKGHIVFLSTTSRYRMEIRPQIKFIDMSEEKIATKECLVGFVKGLLGANYDIEYIFIDGMYKMMGVALDSPEVAEFMATLEIISQKTKVNFVLTISCDRSEMPQFLTKYIK